MAALMLPFSDTAAPRTSGRRRRPAPARPQRPAAGVLLSITDADGVWYLLGKRSKWLGGTWANFGGSLEPDEAPLAGALRELWEEIGLPALAIRGAALRRVIETRVTGSPEQTYTLFVLDVAPAVEHALLDPHPGEVSEVCWWHAAAIGGLRLHSGFRQQWEALR